MKARTLLSSLSLLNSPLMFFLQEIAKYTKQLRELEVSGAMLVNAKALSVVARRCRFPSASFPCHFLVCVSLPRCCS